MEKIKQNFKGTRFYFCVLLFVLILGLIPTFAGAQCNKTGYFPKGGSISLDTNYNSGGYSFWYYQMITDFSNGLSHTNFLVNPVCIKSAIGGTYKKRYDTTTKKVVYDTTIKKNVSVGKDGSYKPLQHYGIKSEEGAGKKDTLWIWFRLDKTYEKGDMPVMVKYSTKFDSTNVCGPNQSCTLPVWFGRVYAISGDGTISVHWTTFTENNNEKFEVERSKNVKEWTKIGEVSGAGNSSQRVDYQLTDNKPLVGKNYFRIKQIDFNKDSTYSPIFSTETPDPEPGLKIYPNPAQNQQEIVISAYGFAIGSLEHTVVIHDNVGKEILLSTFNGPGNILKITLPAGMYTITATGKSTMGRDIQYHQKLGVH